MQELKTKQQPLNGSQPGELCVMATGGGAYKFYDKMKHVLGVEVLREDEMECLIMGLDFFITGRTSPTHSFFVQADWEHRDNVSVVPCSPRKDNAELEK